MPATLNGRPFQLYNGVDPITANRLEVAVNAATTVQRGFLSQLQDPRRNIDDECGYPDTGARIPVQMYKDLFDRDSLAARVVEMFPKETFEVAPTVREDPDNEEDGEFDKAVKALNRSILGAPSWHEQEDNSVIMRELLKADIMSGVGSFGVILLGIRDGRALQEPADGVEVVVNNRRIPDSPPDRDERVQLRNELKVVYNRNPNPSATVRPMGPEMPGTDRQYFDVAGAASGNLPSGGPTSEGDARGTDRQYFGSITGESEGFADKPAKKRQDLTFLQVFDESQVQIVRYEWNLRNPRFGQPVMYRVTLNDPRELHSGIGLPLATVYVHWSRVIHLADNGNNSSKIFAKPRLQQPLNNILGARKLYGGSPEAYWKACLAILSMETHPQLGGDVDVDVGALQDMTEQLFNTLQRSIVTRGMSVKTLAPTVVDPTPHLDKQIEAICILLGCPVRVFKGSERGELASGQDDSAWNDRRRHRQTMYITPRIIVPFFDRLIQLGVLPEPKQYYVVWPDLDASSDADKAGVAVQRTGALVQYIQGGGENAVCLEDYFTDFLGFDKERSKSMAERARKEAEKADEEQTLLAKSKGPEPEPPPGFGGGEQQPGADDVKPPNATENEFDPTQPRDDSGRWSKTPGGGGEHGGGHGGGHGEEHPTGAALAHPGHLGEEFGHFVHVHEIADVGGHMSTAGSVLAAVKLGGGKVGEAVGHAEHVAKQWVSDKIGAAVAKLPPKVQGVVNTVFAVGRIGTKAAFASYSVSQSFAEKVAVERGLPEESARRLRGVLATADVALAKPTVVLAGAAPSFIPMATASYLAYSTARDPMATMRAAVKSVKSAGDRIRDKLQTSDKPTYLAPVHNALAAADYTKIVAFLEKHEYDDECIAYLSAALDAARNVDDAVELAGEAYE